MKILAIIGSPRKGQTDRMLHRFEEEIKALGKNEIEFEYLNLREFNIKPCIGCAVCLEEGEEKCPLKDDRDILLERLKEADGIIFATPNYSLQISGLMKVLFDRLCFVFHRPSLFHKTSMAFVTQGVYGGRGIEKYLNEVASFWGLNVCKGITLNTPWGVRNPKTEYPEIDNGKINSKISEGALRFYKALNAPKNPSPSMKRMLFFRLTRSGHKYSKVHMRDYEYFRDNGFFESSYYYKTKIGLHKKILGTIIDKLIASLSQKA